MPTPASPGTNKFVCDACGRHVNSFGELKDHLRECMAAKKTGSGGREAHGREQLEEHDDREWVSTP